MMTLSLRFMSVGIYTNTSRARVSDFLSGTLTEFCLHSTRGMDRSHQNLHWQIHETHTCVTINVFVGLFSWFYCTIPNYVDLFLEIKCHVEFLLWDFYIDVMESLQRICNDESVIMANPPRCPACRTTLVATRFPVAVICPIIQVPHSIRVFFYFVWFVFINHIFQFYYELCTYCNILDIYLS